MRNNFKNEENSLINKTFYKWLIKNLIQILSIKILQKAKIIINNKMKIKNNNNNKNLQLI